MRKGLAVVDRVLSNRCELGPTKPVRLSGASLKRRERHHLKLIIAGTLAGLTPLVCERLVALGLVRRDGDSFSATVDGRELAKRL